MNMLGHAVKTIKEGKTSRLMGATLGTEVSFSTVGTFVERPKRSEGVKQVDRW